MQEYEEIGASHCQLQLYCFLMLLASEAKEHGKNVILIWKIMIQIWHLTVE